MPWKPKLNEAGQLELKDGLPVFVDPDGKDSTFDPTSMHAKIIDLGRENKTVREKLEAHQQRLKAFDGIEDLAGYRTQADKAMESLKNLKDSRDVQDVAKVEAIKAEMRKASDELEQKLKTQFTTREAELTELTKRKERQIRQLIVSNEFSRSPFFSGTDPKTTLTADVAEAFFGRAFDVREDKAGGVNLVALDERGDPLLSRERIGENANFNEAMQILIDRYPNKAAIMRVKGGGSGGTGGVGSEQQSTGSPIAVLKQQYTKAMENRDAATAISLKSRIVALENAARKQ